MIARIYKIYIKWRWEKLFNKCQTVCKIRASDTPHQRKYCFRPSFGVESAPGHTVGPAFHGMGDGARSQLSCAASTARLRSLHLPNLPPWAKEADLQDACRPCACSEAEGSIASQPPLSGVHGGKDEGEFGGKTWVYPSPGSTVQRNPAQVTANGD